MFLLILSSDFRLKELGEKRHGHGNLRPKQFLGGTFQVCRLSYPTMCIEGRVSSFNLLDFRTWACFRRWTISVPLSIPPQVTGTVLLTFCYVILTLEYGAEQTSTWRIVLPQVFGSAVAHLVSLCFLLPESSYPCRWQGRRRGEMKLLNR